MLGDTELVVFETRGGGYGAGTPREGWDHAQTWLSHALSVTGLSPRFVVVEFTLAETKPALAELKPLAAQSLADGHAAIDGLWKAGESAA